MKFTVDRKTWGRGGGEGTGLLFDPVDEKMCCVGFVCVQSGASKEDINFQGTISESVNHLNPPSWANDFLIRDDGLIHESKWIESAYDINDNPDIQDDEREASLAALFKSNGHELEFVN